MYIPIAALYRSNGTWYGLRFLQWFLSEEVECDIRDDTMTYQSIYCVDGISAIKSCKIVDILQEQLLELKDGPRAVQGEVSLYGMQSIVRVYDNGVVRNDTLVIVLHSFDMKAIGRHTVTVSDYRGNIKEYRCNTLIRLTKKAGIALANIKNVLSPPCYDIFIVHNSLEYATEVYCKQAKCIMSQYELMGIEVKFSVAMGGLEATVQRGDTVIIDESIVNVIVKTTGLKKLVVPEKCGVVGTFDCLTHFKAPVECTRFWISASICDLEEFQFPKRVGSKHHMGTFVCEVGSLPSSVTILDQSEYVLLENSFVVSESCNLQRIIWQGGHIGRSRLSLTSAPFLRYVEILADDNGVGSSHLYFDALARGEELRELTISFRGGCAAGDLSSISFNSLFNGIVTLQTVKKFDGGLNLHINGDNRSKFGTRKLAIIHNIRHISSLVLHDAGGVGIRSSFLFTMIDVQSTDLAVSRKLAKSFLQGSESKAQVLFIRYGALIDDDSGLQAGRERMCREGNDL